MAAATGLLVWLAGTPSAALGQVAEPQRPVVWRVEGGAEALAPSARVRLVVINAVSSDSVDPTLGLVQTVLVLATPPASAAADALALEAVRRGLTVVEPDHELAPAGGGDLRVTVAPAAISTEDYAVAVVLGRPVKVLGLDAAAASGGEYQALRADREDLEDRRRWAAETLIQPGTERQVWEGIVPASVSRIYADALVIRNTRASVAAGSDVPSVTRRLDHPSGGILDLPPSAAGAGPQQRTTGSGLIVERTRDGRLHPLTLEPGRLNLIRVRIILDATGMLQAEVGHESLPLPPPGP